MVITTTTAERLLARVAGGDRMAFAELYERYASAVYGACLRVLREPQAAEDAAQDAFSAIWRHAAAFDPTRGAAGAWIGRVARNAALDANRRRALRVTAPEVDPVDEGATPEELAVAADEAFRLRLALETLRSASGQCSGLPTAMGSPRVRLRSIWDCHLARSRRGREADSPASPITWSGRSERSARTRARTRRADAGQRRPAPRCPRVAARARPGDPRRRRRRRERRPAVPIARRALAPAAPAGARRDRRRRSRDRDRAHGARPARRRHAPSIELEAARVRAEGGGTAQAWRTATAAPTISLHVWKIPRPAPADLRSLARPRRRPPVTRHLQHGRRRQRN